ncbi:hypothetical protein CLOM_g13621 [Closterium sp. NIES-68]|nr:hypothetical protein CLOM_g13621 [Closterium sp. NIES-68]GJP77114.1 hypothetical protein CLOP_g7553 [Closterium sp. NIES-67]
MAGTTGDCRVAQSGESPSALNQVASPQSANEATGPEPPSTARDEPASHRDGSGLSLQQLQHLAALTATNDNPRDTSYVSVFPYASSRDGPPQGRRNRLTLDSSQRRLDSWNRATQPAFGKSFEQIRAQRRMKRSRSEPSQVRSAGKDSESFDSLKPARPLDAVVSEAREQMLRHSLRRSRSAHALGEKDTNALWSDAMTALMWRRGRAVIYRRPYGQAASESAAELANSHDRQVSDGKRQILPTASSADSGRAGLPLPSGANAADAAVTSRRLPSPLAQTYLPSSAASQRPDDSQQSRPWSSASACGRLAAQAASCDCCRVRSAPSAAAHRACDSRTVQPTEMSSSTYAPAVSTSAAGRIYQAHQRQQQQQQRTLNTDPVKSVFAWAAEQRIASRRAQRAQQ